MTTFAVEKFDDCYEEGKHLLELHYREIAPYQDLFQLNVDVDGYRKLEAAGVLKIVIARDAGKIVGYMALLIRSHPHYAHVKVANEDLKFVHPDYRGMTGTKMIKFAEGVARAAGCKVILQRSKAKSGHGALYARLGYDLMDEVYSKRLDQEDAHGN